MLSVKARVIVLFVVASIVVLAPATPANAEVIRPIRFPVDGPVTYINDFGAPRAQGPHQGNDLMGYKLEREVAAHDGTVTYVRVATPGVVNGGNMLIIRDSEGWEYWYIHINNDTPGTDDGLNPPEWRFAPGIAVGTKVFAGQFVAYMGDSGDAENTAPHLHFELHRPDGVAITPYDSLQAASHEPADSRWFLRNTQGTGPAEVSNTFGLPADTPVPC